MNGKQHTICWLATISMFAIHGSLHGADFHLYYLGGQSNMDGHGYVNQLPEPLTKPLEDVWILHGNTSADNEPVDGKGLWARLRPGHGVGFNSDGKEKHYSDRFGVELTFARTLRERFPERRIGIIKSDDYGYSDPWRYDSEGYIDLGRRFAEAIVALEGQD